MAVSIPGAPHGRRPARIFGFEQRAVPGRNRFSLWNSNVGIGQGQPRGALVPVSASAASGKEARQRISRSAQAGWEPGPDRTAAVEILAEQDKSRVPELVPVRYGRMLASAFTFYRGAAAIMAADLAAGPDSGLRVQLCGDAHLSNFGVFQAPDRRLVFDINDFDETLPGPFEWDVKRLAASVAIGARDRGFKKAESAAPRSSARSAPTARRWPASTR